MGYLKTKQETDNWNGVVKCIHCSNNGHLTKDKIYKIVDGILTTDTGVKYYYKDINDMNKHSLVNYFEEINPKEKINMEKSKWNGEIRCIKCLDSEVLTEGKIYKVVDGKIINDKGVISTFQNIDDLNLFPDYNLFEEVFDKIKLLLKHNYHLKIENKSYHINKYPTFNVLSIYNENCKSREYEIRWGESFNTTLADIQPILDILNIEIVEEQPKYKIDIEWKYTEEELEVIKKARIKFKKVGDE